MGAKKGRPKGGPDFRFRRLGTPLRKARLKECPSGDRKRGTYPPLWRLTADPWVETMHQILRYLAGGVKVEKGRPEGGHVRYSVAGAPACMGNAKRIAARIVRAGPSDVIPIDRDDTTYNHCQSCGARVPTMSLLSVDRNDGTGALMSVCLKCQSPEDQRARRAPEPGTLARRIALARAVCTKCGKPCTHCGTGWPDQPNMHPSF